MLKCQKWPKKWFYTIKWLTKKGRIGQNRTKWHSTCLLGLLKEPRTSVGILKLAKVCKLAIIYDGNFSSKSPVCICDITTNLEIQGVLVYRDLNYHEPCNTGIGKRFQFPWLPGFLLITPRNTMIPVFKEWDFFIITGNYFWTLSSR